MESVGSYFDTEAAAWTITNKGSASASATTCAGTYILGGYQVTSTNTVFQRTFSSLPTHDTIYFSFSVWVLDVNVAGDNGDLYEVYFDSINMGTLNTLILTFSPFHLREKEMEISAKIKVWILIFKIWTLLKIFEV